MFADGICRNRNICWLPINNNPWWKFKSKARVSYLGIPRKQIAYACPNQGTGGYAFASIENSCAWQKVKNNFGAWTFNGSVHKNKRICARGKQYSDLYNKLYLDKYETITESDGMEESSIEVSESIFNQNNITIQNIKRELLITDSELFSSFELIMWLPSTSSDSVWKTANTFYEGKVTFNKGKITVTGDFDKNNFILTKDKDGNNICKFNFSILKELPEGINGLTTPIEIVGISDAGIIETDFIVDDNTIYCNIFPNPVTTNLYIQIDSLNQINYIDLYDEQGNSITNLTYNHNNISQTYSINIPIDITRNKYYFIYLNSLKGIIIRKILLN